MDSNTNTNIAPAESTNWVKNRMAAASRETMASVWWDECELMWPTASTTEPTTLTCIRVRAAEFRRSAVGGAAARRTTHHRAPENTILLNFTTILFAYSVRKYTSILYYYTILLYREDEVAELSAVVRVDRCADTAARSGDTSSRGSSSISSRGSSRSRGSGSSGVRSAQGLARRPVAPQANPGGQQRLWWC